MKFLFLYFVLIFSVYSKERIVVLDFIHSSNVSREIAVSSNKYFVSELTKTNQYSIIEKTQLREILKEIEFQQTGCTDTVCEIKIGEMLSADKIASGNIIRKDKKYIITITFRNVKDKSLEFSETIDIYDLNQLELTMNILINKIIPSDNINKKLESSIDNKKQLALNRTVILPGWGHFFINRNKEGFALSSLYVINLLNSIYNFSYKNKEIMGETKKEIHDNRVLYYYINQNFNPPANNPVIAYYFFALGNSTIDHKTSHVWNVSLVSATIVFATMIAAIADIRSMNNETQFFSFLIQPEKDSSKQLSPTPYFKNSTQIEFIYTMRF